jgi:hypothetical protein
MPLSRAAVRIEAHRIGYRKAEGAGADRTREDSP